MSVLFLGDSITAAWSKEGLNAWQTYLAPLGGINFGFNGDCTNDLLQRLDNGLLDQLSPKLIVLLIGTNNTGHRKDPAEKTAKEIAEIVELIHMKKPRVHLLLHALLPRARRPQNPLRQLNERINSIISGFASEHYITYVDLSALFLDENLIIPQSVMFDALHPNTSAYNVWAKQLQIIICKTLDNH